LCEKEAASFLQKKFSLQILARYNKFNLNIVCKLKAASFLPIIGANLNIVYQFAKQSGPNLPNKAALLPIKDWNIVPENFLAQICCRKAPNSAPPY